MTLAVAQIFHPGNARSEEDVRPRRALANPLALGAVALPLLLQVLAVSVEPLAEILRVVPVAPADWLLVGTLAIAPAVLGQLAKLRRGR